MTFLQVSAPRGVVTIHFLSSEVEGEEDKRTDVTGVRVCSLSLKDALVELDEML